MKMMQGAFFLPCSNRSRTRLAPTPTNISTKSEPEIEKNGTFASPAMARASSVLPVPGGPISSTPLGMRPPSFWNFCGSRRNSIISCSSSLASSTPATSLNVTFFCCDECSARAALAEAQGLVAAALHLAHHENPEAQQQHERNGVDQDGNPVAAGVLFDRDLHVLVDQQRGEVVVGVRARWSGTRHRSCTFRERRQ